MDTEPFQNTHIGENSTAPRIKWEVPLWSIMTALGSFGIFSAGLYFSNQNLARSYEQQTIQLRALGEDVRTITNELNKANLTNAAIAFRVDDISRRISVVETGFNQHVIEDKRRK